MWAKTLTKIKFEGILVIEMKNITKSFIFNYYPIILALGALIVALMFQFPFFEINLPENIIKGLNYCGSLLSEGFCFSFMFYYFVDFRPLQKNINHTQKIIKTKISSLKLNVPFIWNNLNVKDFLSLDPKESFFEQLGTPRFPIVPEYMSTWLENWYYRINQTLNEFGEFHQYIEMNFFQEVENIKNELYKLNAIIRLLKVNSKGMIFHFDQNNINAIIEIDKSIQLLNEALPAKWWKDSCSNFPDEIGWRS
jgi:hypothetical protein